MVSAVVAALGTIALSVGVPGARSAGPGTWSEVQGPSLPIASSHVSVLRNADGATLVAYLASANDLEISRVAANGTRESTVAAVPGGSGNVSNEPALVRDQDGKPRLLFSGFRTGVGGGNGVFTSLGNASGSSWSTPALAGGQLPGAGIAATVAADGTAFFAGAAFSLSDSVLLHRGLDPSVAGQSFQGSGSANDPGLAVDGASGAVWVAWSTGAPMHLDVRGADPATGAPAGAVIAAPGSGGAPATITDPGGDNALPVSGRVGHAGVYAAYVDSADQSQLLLWRLGDATPRIVGSSAGNIGIAALAPAPDGGLWMIWQDTTAGVQTIQARELLANGTTLGPITKLPLPSTGHFVDVHALAGSATADHVDLVLAGFSNGELRLFDQQVLAPSGGTGTRTTISGRVTGSDGRPIAGAIIEACPTTGAACPETITDAGGAYQFVGIPPGSYQITAYPPAHRVLAVTTRPALSTVAAGTELAGQDIVMSGPLPKPKHASIAGPGTVAVVDGVPVIVRNQPIWLGDDIVFPHGVTSLSAPPKVIIYPTTNPAAVPTTQPFYRSDLEPVAGGTLPPAPGCDGADPPPDCNVHPPAGCGSPNPPPGCGTGAGPDCPVILAVGLKCGHWGVWVDVHHLQRGPHSGWTICFTYGFKDVPDLVPVHECMTVWIDPSGHVRTTRGVGLPGAKVTLLRAASAGGQFARVANGSAVMSPANRRNSDVTDLVGHFGWDVVGGYYEVEASHPGCTDPKNRHKKSVTTRSYKVPPPVDNIVLTMRCPNPPQVISRPRITGKAKLGRRLTCSTGRWRNDPSKYAYAWRRGRNFVLGATKRTIRVRPADRKDRLVCLVTASSQFGARTASSRPLAVR